METNLIFLILLVVIGVAGIFIGKALASQPPMVKAQMARQEKKEGKKEEILKLLKKKGSIGNNDVEKLLKVSDAAATKYLDELEDEGKIIARGRGKGMNYISAKD